MARTQVIIQKLNKIPLEKEIFQYILPFQEKHLFFLSEETVKEIRRQIERTTARKPASGELASAFFTEKIEGGYGIGNITYLNQNVPYWHWINYGIAQSGRTIPPKTIGHFDGVPEYPSSGAIKTQRWIYTSNKPNYLLIPTKPIEPHNYIEHTVARMDDLINNVFGVVK